MTAMNNLFDKLNAISAGEISKNEYTSITSAYIKEEALENKPFKQIKKVNYTIYIIVIIIGYIILKKL